MQILIHKKKNIDYKQKDTALLKEKNIDNLKVNPSKKNIKKKKIVNNDASCGGEEKIKEKNKTLNDIHVIEKPQSNENENSNILDENNNKKEITSSNDNSNISSSIDKGSKESEYCESLFYDNMSQYLSETINENNNGEIIIKYNDKKIEKDKALSGIRELIRKKDFKSLIKYSFPYMPQIEFNSKIVNLDNDIFRTLLFFYCPECNIRLRHYSMPFHIFQFHHKFINKHLTNKEVAHGCSKLMKNEYKKIKSALENFSELATVYNNCDFRGNSIWREEADAQIEEISNLNIKKSYFEISLSEALKNVEKKLPMNKSKNKGRKFKSIEKAILKYELRAIE